MPDRHLLSRAAPAIVLVVMLLPVMSACGSADTEPTAGAVASPEVSESPATVAPTPTPEQPLPSASSSSPAEAQPSPGDCSRDVRSGVEQTIRAQQQAFAALNFDGARQFATEAFRATVEPNQFREIIEDQYAFLLTDPKVEFVACVSVGDMAETLVRVESEPRSTLRYRLLLEDVGWRIDGAVIVQTQDGIAA